MSKPLLAVSLAIALAGAALGCAPDEGPVPANPTYTTDVQPIFIAHCVHCHGANDMLHTTIVNGFPNNPAWCYLQRYDNEGDCSGLPSDLRDCKLGASGSVCTAQIPLFINLGDDIPSRMPPPPVAPLTDWQKAVVNKWLANGFPK